MIREEIISKGYYVHPQSTDVLSVKQYIILQRHGKKQLLLRMENHRNESVTALSFFVLQYDAKGNLIGRERVDLKDAYLKANAVGSLPRFIPLKAKCVNFRVEIASVAYGNYVYVPKDEGWQIRYEKAERETPVDMENISERMNGKRLVVSPRTLNSKKTLLTIGVSILAVLAIFIGVHLYNFLRTETLFTLDSIEYSFETANRVDGPICVMGYKGNAGNIIIPAEIEGHAVARISQSAFQSSSLRSVVIEGSTILDSQAFASNAFLREVSIKNVTSLGNRVFSGCTSLKDVLMGEKLDSVGAYAFYKCSQLKSIDLPASVKTIGESAFSGCEQLESLTIPTEVTSIGKNVLSGCMSLK